MAFDLGTLIRAAALGGSAYKQAERDTEDRARAQRREDEQEARQRAQDERDAAEAILRQKALRIANERNSRPPEIPPAFTGTVNGIDLRGKSLEDIIQQAAKIRANMPDPDRRTDDRLPHEIELDDLRRREAELRLSGAEREAAEPSEAEARRTAQAADARAALAVTPEETTIGWPNLPGRWDNRPGERTPDAQRTLADLEARNRIRLELVVQGMDPKDIEAEVERRMGRYVPLADQF